MAKWLVTFNIDLKTVEKTYPSKTGALKAANDAMIHGIWTEDSHRLYPPHAILFVELFERAD